MAASVLIAADHAAFRRATRALLEADGFRVVDKAADGESALCGGPSTAGAGIGPETDG